MSWIFGQSEATLLIDSINQSFHESQNLEMITALLKEPILDDETKGKLRAVLDKAICDFLYYCPQLKEVETGTKKLCLERAEKEEKHTQMMPLAQRAKEIMAEIKESYPQDWMRVLLNPGIIGYEYYDSFVKQMDAQTIDFLSNLPQEELISILDALTVYKQTVERNQNKTQEMNQLRNGGAVKSNISSLENLFKNPPSKKTHIITTRPIVIPEAFIRKMNHLHGHKLESLQVPTDNRIYIKETYPGGSQRLKGTRVGKAKVGIWKWWNIKGDPMAEYNYETHKWSYTFTNQIVIKGTGYVGDMKGCVLTKEQITELVDWLNEARENI